MVCVGARIEILTFDFLSNALLLSFASFWDKLKTVAIVYCFFAVLVFALSAAFLLRAHYGKLNKVLRYVNFNCRTQSLSATFFTSASFGLYNVLLGSIHRLLLSFPLLQLYALLTLEAAYFTLITVLLFRKFYKNTLLAAVLCLMNLSRLSFIATFLVFHFRSDLL